MAPLWDVGITHAINKMPVHPALLRAGAEKGGIAMLTVTPEHAVRVADLPPVEDHRDPCDRMLVAQALVDDLVIVTADDKIRDHLAVYGVRIVWAGT